jgi:hypothetical protein
MRQGAQVQRGPDDPQSVRLRLQRPVFLFGRLQGHLEPPARGERKPMMPAPIHPKRLEGFVILAILLAGAVVILGLTAVAQPASAHDPRHPEWNGWLMSQHNQNDVACCDGNDTFVLADNEWRTNGDHYEIFHGGSWQVVPEWALTKSRDNITGNALLWMWQGHVQCFKPGTFY